jgi:hypothetical protein
VARRGIGAGARSACGAAQSGHAATGNTDGARRCRPRTHDSASRAVATRTGSAWQTTKILMRSSPASTRTASSITTPETCPGRSSETRSRPKKTVATYRLHPKKSLRASDGLRGGRRGHASCKPGAGGFPGPTGIFIPKVPEPPGGSPRLLCKSAMFRPRVGTTQNSGGTKPFSSPAKTSGSQRGIPIDHQMKGRKGP